MVKKLLLVTASVALLSGCMSTLFQQEYPPQTAIVLLANQADTAYEHAYKTLAKMPGTRMISNDAKMRVASAEVNNAAVLTVIVEPNGGGSRVTIHGSVMRNKIVRGEFTEVEHLAQAIQRGN